ncbi:MAG: hypothetical protein ACKO7R_03435 [Pseudanabaena sp.]
MGLVSRSIKVGDAILNLSSCDVECGNMRSMSQAIAECSRFRAEHYRIE